MYPLAKRYMMSVSDSCILARLGTNVASVARHIVSVSCVPDPDPVPDLRVALGVGPQSGTLFMDV